MSIRIVRLGTPRAPDEGLRLGTVRRPPRGVRKEDFARLNYFDLWFPDLAPSMPLFSWAVSQPWTDARWKTYARKYVAEMKKPPQQRLIALLAAFSTQTNFSVGCYCENDARCHRSLLADLLRARGADLAP
jgi:uncharacterized protein YeaO (DUF488 family)